jgi:hypothetical protein
MTATRQIVFQYACNYTFAFNLNTTLSAVERALDRTVITTALSGRLNRGVTGCPDQNTQNSRGNASQFHGSVPRVLGHA